MYQTIDEEAWSLVHSLAWQSKNPDGFGTMSPDAYNTAWVAMTEKKDKDGKPRTLFPEAYSYLEETQSKEGSWAAETSDTDGIINTLAALLALKKRERRQAEELRNSEARCQAAEISLRRMLHCWNIEQTDRVGMELLIPNHLRLLENEGITIDFPAKKALMELNATKLARLGATLASPQPTTIVHTLEAFVGTLDFDTVKHHLMPNGSMLASPSATAAYLMNATEWDNDAEAYLSMIFHRHSELGHKGGFPSAYPSTIFETSWVLDTLLDSGFRKDDFLMADIRSATTLLETNLKLGAGTVGWAPSCPQDADDTAKTISALGLLGCDNEVEPMLRSFEGDACFITYSGERNPSLSANCNVLSCLLRTKKPAAYTSQVFKCATFIATIWKDNSARDKWHTSVQYPMMLVAKSFVLLLEKWAKGELDEESCAHVFIYQELPRTLLDILRKTMESQGNDGSWEAKREVTAYAILTLEPLLSLPWIDFLRPEGIACMFRGKAYLEQNRRQWRNAERIWIEKTVYGSTNLSQAYCLAACKIAVPKAIVSAKISEIFPLETMKMIDKMLKFFSGVSPFLDAPKWKLQLSLAQSATYTSKLKLHRHDIFPLMERASGEKYRQYIPFTWIGCRDHLSTPISSRTLCDMMLLSMFNFQVDAFMETVARDCYSGRLQELKTLIRSLCRGYTEGLVCTPGHRTKILVRNELNGTANSVSKDMKSCETEDDGNITYVHGYRAENESVKSTLGKFVDFALQHPKVKASPESMRRWLAHELETFLLAHVTHMEDCDAFVASADSETGCATWRSPRTTFFNWVRTTSADHTSCPFSFVFFLCLIKDSGRSLEFSLPQRYALEDACRHLAAMCRQYNDLGSVARDQEEANLNSVNFLEFSTEETIRATTTDQLVSRKKRDLLEVAEYERRCLNRILGELKEGLDSSTMRKLNLLIGVTDLYGQIYAVRDIGIRGVEAKATKRC